MPRDARFNLNFSIGGTAFQNDGDVVSADEIAEAAPSVPAAQPGELTLRTDNDTGELTMDNADHGITTGAKLDLYFDGGARRRMTVGTVAGLVVPIDAGAGSNLPALNSAIIAAVPVQRDVVATVADIVAYGVKCDYESQFHFMESNGTTEDLTVHLEPETNGQQDAQGWNSGQGATPFTGTTVSKVWMSHADTAAAHEMTVSILKN